MTQWENIKQKIIKLNQENWKNEKKINRENGTKNKKKWDNQQIRNF